MSAAWKVHDLDADLSRLNHLLGIICEIQFALPVGAVDERVDNLLWIAREISDGIMEHQNDKYGVGRSGGDA